MIKDIILHHSGTVQGQDYASTRHHSPESISAYHKSLWNFPSKYIKDETVRYAGYHIIYDPKDRTFTQCRALGEEGAHCIGKNTTSVGLCIIGNYDINPKSGKPVDTLTQQNMSDIKNKLKELVEGTHGFFIVPQTTMLLSGQRIYPHRLFANKSCYGTSLSDEEFTFKKEMNVYEIIMLLIYLIKSGIIKPSAGSIQKEDPDTLPN